MIEQPIAQPAGSPSLRAARTDLVAVSQAEVMAPERNGNQAAPAARSASSALSMSCASL